MLLAFPGSFEKSMPKTIKFCYLQAAFDRLGMPKRVLETPWVTKTAPRGFQKTKVCALSYRSADYFKRNLQKGKLLYEYCSLPNPKVLQCGLRDS